MTFPSKALAPFFALASFLLALPFGGCKSVSTMNSRLDTTIGPKHSLTNVHESEQFPLHLRRVALLPLFKGRYDHIDMELIEANFVQELGKLNLFELVPVEPAKMADLFGVERYSSVEVLPTKLLAKLHETYAM